MHCLIASGKAPREIGAELKSVNMFGYPAGGAFQGSRAYAFNKAQMYAGKPSVQVVTFDAPTADFTILPSNARLQAGTPPAGTPNYFLSTWEFTNALTVYKFHVNWNPELLSRHGSDERVSDRHNAGGLPDWHLGEC